MTRLDVKAAGGTVTGAVDLDPAFFSVQPNVPVIHQVVTAQLAAARRGTQSTKTRAEVSGGGAKPYKQKGTGRARQGSIRAPQYEGGGIALGPKPRSYRQRTPRKMVQLALRGALSDRVASGSLAVVDSWDFAVPSTKSARAALEALGVSGRALLVLSGEDEVAYKSFRNLPHVEVVLAGELAAYDILCSDWVVFTRQALPGQNVWSEATVTPEAAAPVPAGTAASAAPVPEAEAGPAPQAGSGAERPAENAVASASAVSEPEPEGEGSDEEGSVAEDEEA